MAGKKKQWQKAPWSVGQSLESRSTPAAAGGGRGREEARTEGHRGQSGGNPGGQFINPYNFVRVERNEADPDRGPCLHTHEKFHDGCFSGKIVCTMTTVTPAFTPDPEKTKESQGENDPKKLFFSVDREGNPFFPAATIKGMVRNVFETVSNSCFHILDRERLTYRPPGRNSRRQQYRTCVPELLPEHLRPCTDMDKLCPACRVFGLVAEASKTGLKGKVTFGAARLCAEKTEVEASRPLSEDRTLLRALGRPQPTSTNFYLNEDGYVNNPVTVADGGYDRKKPRSILRGRKFYWQQGDPNHPLDPGKYKSPPNDAVPAKFKAEVNLLNKETRFSFTVHFENLTRAELALLVWSLELEDGVYHQIGMGKPLGLGTVQVRIDRRQSHSMNKQALEGYYKHIDGKPALLGKALEVDQLKTEVTAQYGNTLNYKDFSAIRRFRAGIAGLVKYPSKRRGNKYYGYEWFTHARQQGYALHTIDEILEQAKRQQDWEGI